MHVFLFCCMYSFSLMMPFHEFNFHLQFYIYNKSCLNLKTKGGEEVVEVRHGLVNKFFTWGLTWRGKQVLYMGFDMAW